MYKTVPGRFPPVVSFVIPHATTGEDTTMLNRDLLIVRYKQPFVDWINEADPQPDGDRMPVSAVPSFAFAAIAVGKATGRGVFGESPVCASV